MNRLTDLWKNLHWRSLWPPKLARPAPRQIVFWGVAVVLAAAFFLLSRGFITCWALTSLQGIPPASCSTAADSSLTPVFNPKGTPLVAATPTATVAAPIAQAPAWDGGSRINILFVGLRGGSAQDCPLCTDTIIVFTVDPITKTAGMISIPRDMWVNIPGFGYSRINTAYTDGEGSKLPGGGPGLAMKTVSQFLGIPLQYYAQVEFNTFIAFINTIGGVDVYSYEKLTLDPLGDGKDHVQITCCGMRHLDGQVALAYARQRDQQGKTMSGDVDRAKRQQQVILGIRSKVLNPANFPGLIAKAPWFYKTFGAGLHTNMSLEDAVKLAYLMKDIPITQIRTGLIDYTDVTMASTVLGGQAASVFKPIPDRIRLLTDQIFTSSGPVSPIAKGDPVALMQADKAQIRVINGTYTSGLETRTGNFMVSRGLNVTRVGPVTQLYGATTILMYTPKLYTLRYLISLFNSLGLPISGNQIYVKYDPQATIDIEIHLGSDWISKLPPGF